MTAIELTFPAGRFHATPWGRHVNEGAVEWPPSPYRLLRALVATWKRKADHIEEACVRGLLEALCDPPEFALPPATFGHTRHYMPWFKKGPGDKTLVFDAFVAVERHRPVVIAWRNLVLPTKQQAAFAELLSLLGTLGRSESWCEARLLDSAHIPETNCRPINGRPPIGEVVRVLGVDPASAFTSEHNPRHETTSGRGKAKTTTVTPLYEPDWHLCMETLWLHEQRMSQPPGTRWLDYERAKDALATPKPRTHRPSARPAMQVARFALDSAVLPLVTDTLRIAEAARIALMSRHGWITREGEIKGKSAIFSGKDAEGTPLKNHSHAYYLPTDEDGDGRLDHLTVFAANGFGRDELRALDTLRQIKTKDTEQSGHLLGVVLTGLGRLGEFAPGPLRSAANWCSATPFVCPQYPKTRGPLYHSERGASDPHRFLLYQLSKELIHWLKRNQSKVDPASVKIDLALDSDGNTRLPDPKTGEAKGLRPLQFRRFRQKRSDDGGQRLAGFFRLTFPEPVTGPIALGHSSHFGLGLFVPATTPQTSSPPTTNR
jgi:CRISPR-associated protein Csb2